MFKIGQTTPTLVELKSSTELFNSVVDKKGLRYQWFINTFRIKYVPSVLASGSFRPGPRCSTRS